MSNASGTAGRWIPPLLAAGALVALAFALIERGTASLTSVIFFVVLLPAAIATALLRWWPRARHTEVKAQAINWRRKVSLAGAALMAATVLTLVLGVALAGGRVGTTLLVAGALMLPPAALTALLAFLFRREAESPSVERIVFEASVHWGVFLPAIAILTVSLALAAGPFGVAGYGAAVVLYLIVLPGTAARALTTFVNTELTVTETGVVLGYGLLRKRVQRLPRGDVQAVGVDQNWLGRQLGYGKLTIIARDGTGAALYAVADPEGVRRALS
jgi:membrane protein YdbS with pleckstrin-like domain